LVCLLAATACAGKSSTTEASRGTGGALASGGIGGGAGMAASGAPSAGSGGTAAGAAGLAELPFERIFEIELQGFVESAEDLHVGPSGILVVTSVQQHRFGLDGAELSDPVPGGSRSGAAGIDAFENEWVATVLGSSVYWYGAGVSVDALERARAATGIAVDTRDAGPFDRFLVTDSMLGAVVEYGADAELVRDLIVSDADLQGVARSPNDRFFALDAKSSRLLRLESDLSGVDAVVILTPGGGVPSGIHWYEDQLYVCFRDRPHVVVGRVTE
jgi:hypothetical protein